MAVAPRGGKGARMKVLPISLLEPTLAGVRGLRQGSLCRPGSLLKTIRPGDRLWVREPFHLPDAFDDFAPTAAIRRFAKVAYAIDGAPPGFGRRRFAREMPRDAHRMHLVVLTAVVRRLQSVNDDEASANGFGSRDGFARAWDEENRAARSVTGDRVRWADDPIVTWLLIRPRFEPLSLADFAKPARTAA